MKPYEKVVMNPEELDDGSVVVLVEEGFGYLAEAKSILEGE